MLITRTRRLAFVRFEAPHVRPHRSVAPPRTYVASVVVSLEVVFADVRCRHAWVKHR
jgi:hypothetical protein